MSLPGQMSTRFVQGSDDLGGGHTFESETGREAVPKNLRSEAQSTK